MLSSRLERIGMAGSQPMICLIRSITPLTSLREEQMASLQGSSCSIMHPVTRSGPQMPCQHGTCPKGQTSTGLMSKMALGCDQVCMSLRRLKYSITPIAIQLCPAGSKGWKTSFRREVCGQPMYSEPSAKASNVSQAAPIAAAIVSYFANLTSLLRSLSLKNMSLHVVTYVTFIQSSIVNLTLLKCNGTPSSIVTARHHGHLILKLWRQMFSHVSRMSHY